MAAHAEAAVNQAVKALLRRDDDMARKTKEEDCVIDQLETEIDQVALEILADRLNSITELRQVTTALKIAHDLERVGDEATTIARRALELGKEPQLKTDIDLPRLARMTSVMIDDALEAFVNGDIAKATEVVRRDKQVDEVNRQLHRKLSSYMVEDSKSITRCLNLMVVSKSLERIADHAANIAEEVVYLFEARDVRHSTAAIHPPKDPKPDTH